MTTQPKTAAQAILTDTAQIKADIEIILQLARTLAVPDQGDQTSFLETVTKLLGVIVNGIEETQKSVAALHARLEQPGIAAVLQRVMEGD